MHEIFHTYCIGSFGPPVGFC